MRYVVICHTSTLDRSRDNASHITSEQIMRSINRKDAERMVDRLNAHDAGVDYEDGPFIVSRMYEVGAVVYTADSKSRRKVLLSLSDIEAIALEYLGNKTV
jgi:hypothetical protein